MVNALGYVSGPFDATAPGRLCRGRERWIEYETMTLEEEGGPVHRVVLSGACFSDDSARDARRGLSFAQVPIHTLLCALMGPGELIAYCEEGHPRMVPADALGVEHHEVTRPGGPLRRWVTRWAMPCTDAESTQAAIEAGADVFVMLDGNGGPASLVRGTPSVPPSADAPDAEGSPYGNELAEALFLLTGFRNPMRPTRLFQPMGIPAALRHAPAVALLHRDKHGPALGVYTRATPDINATLAPLTVEEEPVLLVPFAIPPMLARWDRALWELRQHWPSEERGEFPVPSARRPERKAAAAAEE